MEPDLCSDDPTRKLIRQILGAFSEYEKISALSIVSLLVYDDYVGGGGRNTSPTLLHYSFTRIVNTIVFTTIRSSMII
jgi:hypothetical protein